MLPGGARRGNPDTRLNWMKVNSMWRALTTAFSHIFELKSIFVKLQELVIIGQIIHCSSDSVIIVNASMQKTSRCVVHV